MHTLLLTGSGSQFDGTVLSARHDLVVVTLNYRLGPFGKLSIAVSTPEYLNRFRSRLI